MGQKNARKLEKRMKYTLDALIRAHNLLEVMGNEHLACCVSIFFEMVIFSIAYYHCSSYLELHIYIPLARITLSR